MHKISFKEMKRMVPEWCFDGNLVYWENWNSENYSQAIPDLIPCVILEYFIFDLDAIPSEEATYSEWHEDEWLYVSAYANGELIKDVHSAFSPLIQQ